jgi:D-glycero-alpha-D-manno-heptose-7-phosphate kinase
MIITKTPYRVSFAGGGTDLPAFSSREYGAVVSMAIDKYIYLALHTYFEKKIVLKYSKTEIVDKVDEIQHPLIRECMRITGTSDNIEITSFADIPSSGSGLGSSSAFCVGLIKALNAHQGKNISAETAASKAAEVEMERLREPIGPQDQYAAAYGGINYIRFNTDGTVHVEPILLSREQREILEDNLIMFYTGITRSASSILTEQQKNTLNDVAKFNNLRKMRDLADELRTKLQSGNIKALGEMLHKGWLLKRELASGISSGKIDEYYERGLMAGATGGKLLGAGGGGFLLFYCEKQKQPELIRELAELKPVKFRFDMQGARVIYVDD